MMAAPDKLVIVTGLSGSGKSYVQSTLEDLGFYCVDNLPVPLIDSFIDELTGEGQKKIGIVIDVRAYEFARSFPQQFARLKERLPGTVLMFLEARDDVIVRRFSETRRPHPYGAHRPILEAVKEERRGLTEIKALANMVLDTSEFSVHELKAEITKRFELPGYELPMLVSIVSFGFKYSAPTNVDLLFDVRFLPNPHFVEELRPKTGLDSEVVIYLEQQEEYGEFVERLGDMIEYLLPRYEKEMKSYLTIGIGCTGGKHRSVAVSEKLGQKISELGYRVTVSHRDCRK